MASSNKMINRRRSNGTPTNATAAASQALSSSNKPKASQKSFEQLRRLILGRTPLLEDIRALVEADPRCVECCDVHHGLLPLHWACVFQNPLEIVQYLVEVYPPALLQQDQDGRTPLHHACRPEGKTEVVAYLLEHLSSTQHRGGTHVVAQRDHRGKTPLHCACAEFVPWQIVQLLLDAHPAAAKVRTRDHGQTPLHLACEYNAPRQTIHLLVDAYPEAVKYLRVVDNSQEEEGNENFQLARDYLALKVRQTEQEADRYEKAPLGNSNTDPPIGNITDLSTMTPAERQQREALQRLQHDHLDVEQKAAELDRLIQQKESNLSTERFQRVLNDSGIGKSRSFEAPRSRHAADVITAARSPPPKARSSSQQPRPESRTQRNSLNMTDSADEEMLFDSLRGNHTQGLYPESQVTSVTTGIQHRSTTSNALDESGIGRNRDSSMMAVPPRDPSVANTYGSDKDSVNVSSNKNNPQQQLELQEALQLLEESEQRRETEARQAQAQQELLENELGVLMDKLAGTAKTTTEQHPQDPEEEQPDLHRTPSLTSTINTQSVAPMLMRQPLQPGGAHRLGLGDGRELPSAPPTGTQNKLPAKDDPSVRQEQKPRAKIKRSTREYTDNEKKSMKDANGMTPLHLACANGASYTVLQYLLQMFPMAVYQTDQLGNTPLHHACACPNTTFENFQLLLGVFPAALLMTNHESAGEQAPLHLVCQHYAQRLEVIQLLLETQQGLEQEIEDAKDDALRQQQKEDK